MKIVFLHKTSFMMFSKILPNLWKIKTKMLGYTYLSKCTAAIVTLSNLNPFQFHLYDMRLFTMHLCKPNVIFVVLQGNHVSIISEEVV